jgi:hypothetical protein
MEFLPGGSVELFTFIDGAVAGDFVRGFRRDEPNLSYLLRLTVDGQFAFTQAIGDIPGPVGCEWKTPAGGGGTVQNYNFDRPLFAEGTHVRDNLRFGVPIPSDGVPNGDLRASGGWACMYYRLAATCTSLTAEAEWVRGDDLNNPSLRMSAKQVWTKTINASLTGPCTGGCATLPVVPPASPVPPGGPISGVPDLRSILGGVWPESRMTVFDIVGAVFVAMVVLPLVVGYVCVWRMAIDDIRREGSWQIAGMLMLLTGLAGFVCMVLIASAAQ